MCLGHVTEFCELVCVLVVLTKVSHACGWHFVPADWAGWATLRFMVDIITLSIARNSSDWLHTVQGFVCYALLGLGVTSPVGWLGACPCPYLRHHTLPYIFGTEPGGIKLCEFLHVAQASVGYASALGSECLFSSSPTPLTHLAQHLRRHRAARMHCCPLHSHLSAFFLLLSTRHSIECK